MKERCFIVIEGTDCSGKSAVGRELAARRNISIVENPTEPFSEIKQAVLEQCEPLSRLVYFIAANLQAGFVASKTRNSVVMVRYFWSTLAYYAAMEKTSVEALVELLGGALKMLVLPDRVIYLRVSRDVQVNRARGRNDDPLQARLLQSDDFQKRLDTAYAAVRRVGAVPWIDIDTSALSLEEVSEQVLTCVDQLMR